MTEHDIFTAAIKLTGDPRAVFLIAACGQDSKLREQVDALLRAHDESGGLLPRQAERKLDDQRLEATHMAASQAAPGTVIAGRYKLLEAIGEGGMGSVWLAEQREPVRRKVAVKLIKAGMDTKSVLARFEAERQALAMMDHPNIAKVFDGGMTDQGRPFFVMEYVKGMPLTEYCDQAQLSLKERLSLFMQVCQAVQHAHQKGIIHRDLKPSNILICLYDGKPVPKVIDFGLAKAMYQSLTEQSLHTAHGVMVGTPLYMSPEQAEHNNLDVDTRTDIYSLGVILYELLTGSTPLEKLQLKAAAFNEILRLIKEVEPPRPSTRLSSSASLPSIAAQRSIEPHQLKKSLIGDLDWIVMKAIDKERSRRYETANGLARDVERFLNVEAVEACPPTAVYKLRKYIRRNRGLVLAASAVLSAMLLGIAGTTLGLLEAKRQAAIALVAAEEKETARKQEADQRTIAESNQRRAEQAEADTLSDYQASTDDAIEQLIGSKDELGPREKTYLENTLQRWQAFASRQGDDQRSRAIRAEGHFRVASLWHILGQNEEARGEYLVALSLRKTLAEQFPAVSKYKQSLSFTHNNLGLVLVDLGKAEEARAEYEAARIIEKEMVEKFPAVPAYQQELAGIQNNLGRLLAGLGKREESRAAYRAACELLQKLVSEFPAMQEYTLELARTHNNLGNLLAGLEERDEALAEYHTAQDSLKKLVEQFADNPAYRREMAHTCNNIGFLLVALGRGDEARAEYETARNSFKELVKQFPSMPLYQRELASIHNNLGLLLARAETAEESREEYEMARVLQDKLAAQNPGIPGYQQELARTHNNLGLLLGGLGRTEAAHAEYQAARKLREKLVEQFSDVTEYRIELAVNYLSVGVLFFEEEKPAESLEWYNLAIHDLKSITDKYPDNENAKLFIRHSHTYRALAYDRMLDLYRPATSSAAGDSDLRGFEWYYWDRMTSERNERASNAGDHATLLEPLTLMSNSGGIRCVAVSPDSRSLASASQNGDLAIWDSTNGLLRLSLGKQRSGRHVFYSETERPASPPAFAGDPRRVYRSVGEAELFSSVSAGIEFPGTEIPSVVNGVPPFPGSVDVGLASNTGPVAATSVVFSPDGSRLASAGSDGWIRIWDCSTGQLMDQTRHSTKINGLAFSRDGARLASAGNDGTVRIWQLGTSGNSFTVRGHNGSVKSVAFSPDGFSLASAGSEGNVKLWDAANGYELGGLVGHSGMVTSVVFSPDGERLASASIDQSIKVWNTRSGKELVSLKGHTGTVTSVVFSPDGKRLASGSYDQTVKVWDAASGLELLTLKGHTGAVTSLAFSCDGQRIVSGSFDQTMKIWDARPRTVALELQQ